MEGDYAVMGIGIERVVGWFGWVVPVVDAGIGPGPLAFSALAHFNHGLVHTLYHKT